jgi:hypothetical protein
MDTFYKKLSDEILSDLGMDFRLAKVITTKLRGYSIKFMPLY